MASTFRFSTTGRVSLRVGAASISPSQSRQQYGLPIPRQLTPSPLNLFPLSGDEAEVKIREKDCWFFEKLCDASRDGAIQLVTSMLTVAECLHIDEPGGPTKKNQQMFVEFLTSGSVVHLVEPDLFVAERAKGSLTGKTAYS